MPHDCIFYIVYRDDTQLVSIFYDHEHLSRHPPISKPQAKTLQSQPNESCRIAIRRAVLKEDGTDYTFLNVEFEAYCHNETFLTMLSEPGRHARHLPSRRHQAQSQSGEEPITRTRSGGCRRPGGFRSAALSRTKRTNGWSIIHGVES